MSIKSEPCCFIGGGRLYLDAAAGDLSYGYNYGLSYGQAQKAYSLNSFAGNVKSFSITPEIREHKTFEDIGAHKSSICSAFTVESVNLSLTFTCHGFESFKKYFYSDSSVEYPSNPTDPIVVMPECGNSFEAGTIIGFDTLGLDESQVIIKRTDTMAVISTDFYSVSPIGISITSLIALPPGVGLEITYGYDLSAGYEVHNTLQNQTAIQKLVFHGFNKVNDDEYFIVTVFKAKFQPVTDYNFINDTFQEITLTASVQLDRKKDASNNITDSYFTIKRYKKGGVILCP